MDLHFNQSLANGYHSGSQISRVLTEDWMERNMFCPVCGAPVLGHYGANKPVADFFCDDCKSDFELKSKESKTAVIGHKNHDRFLIIDDSVYLLGASVKDMGNGLCAVTKLQALPEIILGLLK